MDQIVEIGAAMLLCQVQRLGRSNEVCAGAPQKCLATRFFIAIVQVSTTAVRDGDGWGFSVEVGLSAR